MEEYNHVRRVNNNIPSSKQNYSLRAQHIQTETFERTSICFHHSSKTLLESYGYLWGRTSAKNISKQAPGKLSQHTSKNCMSVDFIVPHILQLTSSSLFRFTFPAIFQKKKFRFTNCSADCILPLQTCQKKISIFKDSFAFQIHIIHLFLRDIIHLLT